MRASEIIRAVASKLLASRNIANQSIAVNPHSFFEGLKDRGDGSPVCFPLYSDPGIKIMYECAFLSTVSVLLDPWITKVAMIFILQALPRLQDQPNRSRPPNGSHTRRSAAAGKHEEKPLPCPTESCVSFRTLLHISHLTEHHAGEDTKVSLTGACHCSTQHAWS